MVEFCRPFHLNLRTSFHKVLAASLLLGIFYATNAPLAAQFVLTGQVIDESTREPLAFAVIADASSQRAAFSDIDGNFSLNANSSVLEIHVRLLGYEASRIKVNIDRPVVIALRPITQSLAEIIILPGVNPADLIIQKAIDMKPANDPMRRSFACDAYFKLLVGRNSDSDGSKATESVSTDSAELALQKFLQEKYLFLMETSVHKEFAPPDKRLDVIKAHRVSGIMQSADMFVTAYQLQELSAYGETFNVMGRSFTAPLSDRAFKNYRYQLEDSVFQEQDTLLGIRFWPRKSQLATELSGKLYLHHRDFAIVNFSASLPDSADLAVSIKQQYKKHENQYWFPDQSDTYLTFENIRVLNKPLQGFSKQYFQRIDFRPKFEQNKFGPISVVADQYPTSETDSLWMNARMVALTDKELRTYQTIDSLGRVARLDQKLQRFSSLTRGSIDFGPLEWNINNFIAYNPFERIRICADIRTGRNVSTHWSTGAYVAYGTGDKAWKYGGDVKVRLSRNRDVWTAAKYQNDVFESGGNTIAPDKFEPLGIDLYRIFVSRMDRRERVELSISGRIWRTLSGKCIVMVQQISPFEGMKFKTAENENVSLFKDDFLNTEYALELRWAPGEKIMKTRQGEVKLQGHMPIVKVRYGFSPSSFSYNDFTYNRFDIRIQKTFHLLDLGKFSASLVAGGVDRAIPYSLLYNGRGAYRNFAPLSDETFLTMRTNEFQHSQFASVFLRHNFERILVGKGKFTMQPAIKGAAILGKAMDLGRYEYTPNAAEKGYYEAGIELNQLMKVNTLALGLGMNYRMGAYAFAKSADNFAYVMTLTGNL